MRDWIFRPGKKEDLPQVLGLIKGLAEFENAEEKVENTLEKMEEDGFGQNPVFRFFVAEEEGELHAFALTNYRYSTWKGKVLFLEDLFVQAPYRGMGIGKRLLKMCLELAANEKLPWLCLQVLDWNQPAIEFYQKFGAFQDPDWINVMIPVNPPH